MPESTEPSIAPTADVPAVDVPAVEPTPTDEEVVAIMAAMEALWPRPTVATEPAAARSTSWRFSGRWWARPVPVRRGRPFR